MKYLGIRWVREQAYFPLIIHWLAVVMQSYEQMLMINTNWMMQGSDIFLVEWTEHYYHALDDDDVDDDDETKLFVQN